MEIDIKLWTSSSHHIYYATSWLPRHIAMTYLALKMQFIPRQAKYPSQVFVVRLVAIFNICTSQPRWQGHDNIMKLYLNCKTTSPNQIAWQGLSILQRNLRILLLCIQHLPNTDELSQLPASIIDFIVCLPNYVPWIVKLCYNLENRAEILF